jgi:hypothetical protein
MGSGKPSGHNARTMQTPDITTTLRLFLYAWLLWGAVMLTVVVSRWIVVHEEDLVGYYNFTVTPIAPEDWNE